MEVFVHGETAAVLAHVLAILLLAMALEVRRVGVTSRQSRIGFGIVYGVFAVVETALIASIDDTLVPVRWPDLVAGISISVLLLIVYRLSIQPGTPERGEQP